MLLCPLALFLKACPLGRVVDGGTEAVPRCALEAAALVPLARLLGLGVVARCRAEPYDLGLGAHRRGAAALRRGRLGVHPRQAGVITFHLRGLQALLRAPT